jgi:hypothetical protein
MNELYPEDVQRIVTSLPKDVVQLLKKNPGLFLAGGFIRARIAGEEVNDIDIWGSSDEQLNIAAQLFAAQRQVRVMSTQNAHTILTRGQTPVQFITRWKFDNPEACCESFDFTIASAAIWYSDRQWHSYCNERFYRDLASKSLTYMTPVRNEDAGGSFMRLQKFIAKGYRISPGNLAKVTARLLRGIRYDDFLSKPEDWQAQVILGMLREVDPLIVVDGVELEDEELSAEFQAESMGIDIPELP